MNVYSFKGSYGGIHVLTQAAKEEQKRFRPMGSTVEGKSKSVAEYQRSFWEYGNYSPQEEKNGKAGLKFKATSFLGMETLERGPLEARTGLYLVASGFCTYPF